MWPTDISNFNPQTMMSMMTKVVESFSTTTIQKDSSIFPNSFYTQPAPQPIYGFPQSGAALMPTHTLYNFGSGMYNLIAKYRSPVYRQPLSVTLGMLNNPYNTPFENNPLDWLLGTQYYTQGGPTNGSAPAVQTHTQTQVQTVFSAMGGITPGQAQAPTQPKQPDPPGTITVSASRREKALNSAKQTSSNPMQPPKTTLSYPAENEHLGQNIIVENGSGNVTINNNFNITKNEESVKHSFNKDDD